MMVAVAIYSIAPLVIVRSGGIAAPFYFSAIWRFGSACGTLVLLFLFFRPLLLDRRTLTFSAHSAISRYTLAAIPDGLTYGLFAAATELIDPAIPESTDATLRCWSDEG